MEVMEPKTNIGQDGPYAGKNEHPLYVEMGKRLRIFRIQRNYTQEQMAEILGISAAYYGKVERGVHGLSLEKLVTVNKKLGIDINYLLTGTKGEEISLDKVIGECPQDKRYALEQVLKYVVLLAGEIKG